MSLINSYLVGIGATWPFLLGGQAHWTVGLVATLISISSIIAADTFAFIGGKVYRLISLQITISIFFLYKSTVLCCGRKSVLTVNWFI